MSTITIPIHLCRKKILDFFSQFFLKLLLLLALITTSQAFASSISGTVFEDINYGGGAGRDFASASGAGISGATLELYDSSGALVGSTTTASGGTYSFNSLVAGNYYVRVVNDTVNSTRVGSTGAELGVQTFRTDGSTAVTNEVGGRVPALADVAVNSGTEVLNTSSFVLGSAGGGQVQSVQPVTLSTSAIVGVDFGFNFDTIVNTNNTGQGSLRQFILNSNLLSNSGLDQVDNPSDGAANPVAGVETSIFMLSGSGTHTISLSSALPSITGAAGAATAIDASTQSGTNCSASGRTLKITLDGTNAGASSSGLTVDAANVKIRGIAIGKFTNAGITGTANGDNLNITCSNVGLASDGTTALTNTLSGIHAKSGLSGLVVGGGSVDDRNVISNNGRDGVFLEGATTALIENNYIGTTADGLTARSNNQEGASYAGIGTGSTASGITIRNNLLSGNDILTGAGPIFNVSSGIRLETANTITVVGNRIGTNPTGTAALANSGYGVYIKGATDITIGGTTAVDRNIISGNGKDGINTRFGTKRLNIYGNYIGVDINGTAAVPNVDNGIFLADTDTTNIGNADASGRNIVSGNKITGIRNSTSINTIMAGNYVGLDATGTAVLGNTLHGIYIQNSLGVTVGGTTAGARNIISGNKTIGIFTQNTSGTTTTNPRIEGNYIGLLPDGDTVAGNTQAGIETTATNGVVIHNNVISGNKTRGIHPMNSPSTTITNNIIGLNAAGTTKRPNLEHGIDIETVAATLLIENNTISGNGKSGIRMYSGAATSGRVINNRIGLGVDGTTALGNTNAGVLIDSITALTVGGTGVTDANIIAHNGGDAVSLTGTGNKNNTISRNSFFANGNLGIDLDDNNVTLNDGSATSTGANEGTNFPQFKAVHLAGGNLTISGCAPTGSTIELFEADVSPTSSSGVAVGANKVGHTQDYGEGERYLATFTEGTGEDTPTTPVDCSTLTDGDANNATGMSAFQWTVSAPSNIVIGDKLTATATSASGTSEFSSVAAADIPNVPPVITSNGGAVSAAIAVAENQTAVTTVTATDTNTTDTLTYSITGGADAAKFAIDASTGVLSFIAAPDYETPTDSGANNVYDVQVTVVDGKGGTDLQDIAVTVTDVVENAPPVITSNGGDVSAAIAVAENQTAVTTVTATDTNTTDTLTYSLTGGADAAKFAINAATGELVFIAAPDYGSPTDVGMDNVYDVQVTVTDSQNATDVQDIAVSVMAVIANVCPAGTTQLFSDDFGSGGPRTAAEVLGHSYDPVTINDGAYVVNNPRNMMPWYFGEGTLDDHTPNDTNGSALAINMVAAPIVFYEKQVTGIAGVPISFQAWINGTCLNCEGRGQLEFMVQDLSGNTLYKSGSTYAVPNDQTWYKRSFSFNPGANSSFKVVLRNDAGMSYGNDILIDDIALCQMTQDHSDAPTSYGNTTHNIDNITYLGGGETPDADPHSAAGINGDSDDGVTLPTLTQGQTSTMTATVVGAGYLQGWLDWNGNGTFEATEQIATNLQDNGVGDTDPTVGTIKWEVATPASTATAATYARFRWSTLAGLDSIVAANDGEVEDYSLVINALPVLSSNGGGASVVLVVPENQTTVTTVIASDANIGDTLAYSISGGADAAKFAIDTNTGVLTFVSAPDYESPTDVGTDNIYDVQVTVVDGQGAADTQDIAVTVTNLVEGVVLNVKGFLQGSFDSTSTLMLDTLRTSSLIPSTQPYTMTPFNYTGVEVADSTLMTITGNDAVVDWVLVELRDATTPTTVVATQAALLQRDGDVVRADTGAIDINLMSVSAGSYYVVLRHRNHLGVMTANPIALSTTPTLVDFTQSTTATNGTHARLEAGTVALMWAGDANKSNHIIANGPDNDTSDILGNVLMGEGNTLVNGNFRLTGYRTTDFDMNGYTLFAGPNNDTNILLGNVLLHPANSTYSANYVINSGLPK